MTAFHDNSDELLPQTDGTSAGEKPSASKVPYRSESPLSHAPGRARMGSAAVLLGLGMFWACNSGGEAETSGPSVAGSSGSSGSGAAGSSSTLGGEQAMAGDFSAGETSAAGTTSGADQGGSSSGGGPAGESAGERAAGGDDDPAGGQNSGGQSAAGDEDGGAAGAAAASSEPCLEFAEPTLVGTVESSVLLALSGLVASREQPGILYAHADVGDSGRFFAIDSSGRTLAEFVLDGAPATDWEDAAIGPGPEQGATYLYLADIGDNPARTGQGAPREEIQVIRLIEPEVSLSQTPQVVTLDSWDSLRFTYPDAPRDAESLIVDPITSEMVLITKDDDDISSVFRAVGSPDTPAVLEKLTDITLVERSAAADISPSGDRILLRTSGSVLLWPRAEEFLQSFEAAPHMLPAAEEAQSEGITFSSDGSSFFTAGEQTGDIYEYQAACP